MKKFIPIIALALSMGSCTPKILYPAFNQANFGVSFKQASQGGKVFLSESEKVNFDYEQVGSLCVIETSGDTAPYGQKPPKRKIIAHMPGDDTYGGTTETIEYSLKPTANWRYANYESALDYAAKRALEMGGDGIINLRYERKGSDSIVITGWVIKRK